MDMRNPTILIADGTHVPANPNSYKQDSNILFMGIKIQHEIIFPDEFPEISVGILLYDKKILITGHMNGYLMKWDLETGKHEKLHECHSKIETISISPCANILVGCNSGLLFIFSLSSPKEQSILQEADYSKFSRVWRSVWPTEKNILHTSTYGGFYHHSKENTSWKTVSLAGHSNSIFAVGSQNGKLLATGDYNGLITIWEFKEDSYQSIGRLKLHDYVEGISWVKDDTFATIDKLGHINVVEFDPDTKAWKIVYEADMTTSAGTSINVTDDKKTIFAGSKTEIIQFDLDSQQLQTIDLKQSKRIFSKGNTIHVLTPKGLFSFERTEIEAPVNTVKYKYVKIGVIGKTGVGKSTLCNLILNGSRDHLESTFGRKVWTWTLPQNKSGFEKHVVFHDYGGQEEVLGTFLPSLTDSDIVLVLFNQIDKSTFTTACYILRELQSITHKELKLFLVQTHIDHEMNVIDSNQIDILKNSNQIMDCLKVSSRNDKSIADLKKRLTDEIHWSGSRTMIQSESSTRFSKIIIDLQMNGASVLNFNEFKRHYNEITGLNIPTAHLKFLLKSFSSQGLIEYYSKLESIIFQDETFEKLRTNIPVLVAHNNGIISINTIEKKFGKSSYVSILDRFFLNSNFSIQHGDLRIFPDYLKKEGIKIRKSLEELLRNNKFIHQDLCFSLQQIDRINLIKALIELQLQSIEISSNEGLFAWQNNACVYYIISESGNELNGKKLKVEYAIGGKNKSICQRLHKDFVAILTRILGTPLQDTSC